MTTRALDRAKSLPNLLATIGGLFLLITLAVIANTVRLTVGERVRDIGTLRAIGFKARTIQLLILAETTLVCLFGAAFGALLAWALVGEGLDTPGWRLGKITVDPTHVLIGIGIGVVVAALASSVPAFRASRLQVIEALRDT
jgi:putative ABC transport system permease protein